MTAKSNAAARYSLNAKGVFKIENYNESKTFSNFFPGVAGVWGIPMWVFTVNRGQCISSFGIEDKDKAIVEFQPANKAYRLTALQGFRTFIKVHAGQKIHYWEPFQKNLLGTLYKVKQSMAMTAHDLTLEETNEDLGLKIIVNYFTVPQESFSGLIRHITIKNLTRKNLKLEILDGLPIINAFGLGDWASKNMSRTAEAWIKVRNLVHQIPFYQLNVKIADKPEVNHIKEGNFFFSFDPKQPGALLAPIVEALAIFGEATNYSAPQRFLSKDFTLPKEQKTENKTPSAFAYSSCEFRAGATREVVSVFGYAHRIEEAEGIAAKITRPGYIQEKARENKEIINGIRNFTATKSSSPAFDLYATHTFLDNVLRGGLPVSIKTQQGNIAFNVYSRKHGDPERDYNYFNISPTFYSQGNGNYRDVNQNRRNDVFFNTDVKDGHLHTFMNLIQADGYNPLIVKGAAFSIDQKEKLNALLHKAVDKDKKLLQLFDKPFRLGEILTYISNAGIKLKMDRKEFIGRLLELCQKHESAEHGEGFWSDHWSYNLDLIESYLSLYPDKLKEVLFERGDFTFYLNNHYVLPRDQRYALNHRGVRQYASVAKKEVASNSFVLKTKNGEGAVLKTNLFTKLLCLIANKTATLDPSGIGVEMEADKPNWYDALNGLPGLLGSSISEAIEIKRFAQYLLDAIHQVGVPKSMAVFEELATFISGLSNLLALEEAPLAYWQKSNDIKEHYRQRVRDGIDGAMVTLSADEIKEFLNQVIRRIDKGVVAAKGKKGFLPTYFTHEVTKYEKVDKSSTDEKSFVRPSAFMRHDLPQFLEGYVHAIRASRSKNEGLGYYQMVRESPLFDKKLKMYKVNENLSGETEEIGRTRIFPSGWLENESIWLHMEYKFMLELIRQGLHEEFYENFKNVLIPFQRPERYGRSILENSSFLVSSAHEDPALHGQGFVARLSGSTAEFVHMWLTMNVGTRPFSLNTQGELICQLQPALPGWLFTTKSATLDLLTKDQCWTSIPLPKNSYAFNFLSGMGVVYHNPKRRDTFGPKAVKPKKVRLTYVDRPQPVELKTAIIPVPYAQDIRDLKIARIDVFLE